MAGIADVITVGMTAQDRHIKMGSPKGSAFVGMSLREMEQYLAFQDTARTLAWHNQGTEVVYHLCASMPADDVERARAAYVAVLYQDITGISAPAAYKMTSDVWTRLGNPEGGSRFLNNAVDVYSNSEEPERAALTHGLMSVQVIPG